MPEIFMETKTDGYMEFCIKANLERINDANTGLDIKSGIGMGLTHKAYKK